MNIHIPSTPRHLRITQTMQEDFLIDPVLGMRVIMGVELDACQALRLRTYWWCPNVIDSSGIGTGKSFNYWAFLCLRGVLIEDQSMMAYYQTFSTGKQVFWPNFRTITNPIFRAQIGKVDYEGDKEGKDNVKDPACWIQYFKNESVIRMPAPNWVQGATGQAGLDLNVAGLDEWTKSTAMGKDGLGNDGINKQILSRVRRHSFNQHHPLWGNHRLFLASAESPSHPAYKRYKVFQKQIARGNPNYAIISYSFKDFSNRKCVTGKTFKDEYRNEQTYFDLKAQLSAAEFQRQGLGIWARETKGWYSEENLQKCVDAGKAWGTQPETALVSGPRATEEMAI